MSLQTKDTGTSAIEMNSNSKVNDDCFTYSFKLNYYNIYLKYFLFINQLLNLILNFEVF